MIEFKGYITGSAEKRFIKRGRLILRNGICISFLLFFPGFFTFVRLYGKTSWFIAYLIVMLLCILLVYIPKSKKSLNSIKPNRIFLDEDTIVCVAEKYTESKSLSAVKIVRDFGDFYEIIFKVGNISEKFICQKDLLTKGSLEDFERIFNDMGKLERIS